MSWCCSPTRHTSDHTSFRKLWRLHWALFATLILPRIGVCQVDDFSSGNDKAWTHYAPLGGSFTESFGMYTLFAAASPNVAAYGPARVASLREDHTYANFVETVDLMKWDTNHDQAAGLLARITNVGPGSSDGYGFSYASDSHEIDINSLVGENPHNLAFAAVTLTPNAGYRLVFSGVGTSLTGSVYSLSNPTTAIATIHANDSLWTTGVSGLITADTSFTSTASATFDNYAAVPEPGFKWIATMAGLFPISMRNRLGLIRHS